MQGPHQLLLHMDSSDSIMESSEVVQGTESGWTMYIGSPTHASEAESFDEENKLEDFSGGEDDDSMASDASSGPSRPEAADSHETRLHDAEPEPHRINFSHAVMKNIRREERFRSHVNNPQELVGNAATAFSRIRGRTRARKNKMG